MRNKRSHNREAIRALVLLWATGVLASLAVPALNFLIDHFPSVFCYGLVAISCVVIPIMLGISVWMLLGITVPSTREKIDRELSKIAEFL